MTNVEHIPIVKHIGIEELQRLIDGVDSTDMSYVEKNRVKQRLSFVLLRYRGYSIAEATRALMINRQSGYNWQAVWNEKGPSGLRPAFDGGAPLKLNEQDRSDLYEYVVGRELCTNSIRDYVIKKYGVDYSRVHIGRILCSFGLVYKRRNEEELNNAGTTRVVDCVSSRRYWAKP